MSEYKLTKGGNKGMGADTTVGYRKAAASSTVAERACVSFMFKHVDGKAEWAVHRRGQTTTCAR